MVDDLEKGVNVFAENNRMTLKIWDVPAKTGAEFIQFAREECGNRSWIALEKLMEVRKVLHKLLEHEERIKSLEQRAQVMKSEQPEQKVVKTLGGELPIKTGE